MKMKKVFMCACCQERHAVTEGFCPPCLDALCWAETVSARPVKENKKEEEADR